MTITPGIISAMTLNRVPCCIRRPRPAMPGWPRIPTPVMKYRPRRRRDAPGWLRIPVRILSRMRREMLPMRSWRHFWIPCCQRRTARGLSGIPGETERGRTDTITSPIVTTGLSQTTTPGPMKRRKRRTITTRCIRLQAFPTVGKWSGPLLPT